MKFEFIKGFLFLILICALMFDIKAQDTSNVISKYFQLDLDVEFKQVYLNTPFEIETRVDPRIQILRRKDTLEFYSPLMHSSSYFKLGTKINYKNKYYLNFVSFFEQQSWSEGEYFKNTLFNYSNANILLKDTIRFNKNKEITWTSKIGNLYISDETTSGLRAYNLDFLGAQASLSYKRNSLLLLYSTDFSLSVGLNIDEYVFMKAIRKYKYHNNNLIKYGITSTLVRRNQDGALQDINEASGGILIEHKINNFSYSLMSDFSKPKHIIQQKFANLGACLSIDYSLKKSVDFELLFGIKARYIGEGYYSNFYQSVYNGGYRYRNDSVKEYEGDITYPIKNYFRPVSQFAFYSEYRNAGDLVGIELNVKLKHKIFRQINHEFMLETISVFHNGFYAFLRMSKNYNYLFYTSFIHLKLFSGFDIGIYISNKQMNRDVQYMGFYQMQNPFFGMHIRYNGLFKLI